MTASVLLLLALLLVGVVLGVAWGYGRLQIRPITEDEAQDHYAQMRAQRERKERDAA